MADPSIQTFCCHQSADVESVSSIMLEFNSDVYNAVCVASSSIGIVGAIYQILPREEVRQPHRWHMQSTSRGKQIIVWLAIADLLASLGVFVRSMVWLNSDDLMPAVGGNASILFCAVTSAWVQYFYTATWIWTLCYALDMRLFLKDRPGHPEWYHIISWVLPAILTSVGLSLLYIPNADCHNLMSLRSALARVFPNYCATYMPILTVMVVNPVLYVLSMRDIELVVASSLGQYTGKERTQVDSIRLKFALINLAFYLCWLPNLVNGILLWTLWFQLPHQVIILLWYIMAVVNPLQALFNSLVYHRWGDSKQRVFIPFRRLRSHDSTSSSEASVAHEMHFGLQGITAQAVGNVFLQKVSCREGACTKD